MKIITQVKMLRLVADNRSMPALEYFVVILVAGSGLKSEQMKRLKCSANKLACVDLGLT
jgi:hypothetical protein